MRIAYKQLAALAVVAVACVGVQAEVWTGGGDGVSYEDALNWNPSTNAFPGTTRDINGAFTVDRNVSITASRTFVNGGATLNVASGTHSDSQAGNTIRNFVGHNSVGTVNVSGGSYNIGHILLVGSGSGDGTFNLTGGSLVVSRGGNSFIGVSGGSSIEIGVGTATGLLEITGGSLATRIGVGVGAGGTFSVQGSGASNIGIGSNGGSDGHWNQDAGGTLSIGIDAGGVTPILVDYVDGTGGSGTFLGIATFDLNSELDVAFLGGHEETNAWVVMEAEGGIVDNGLTLAAGVDPDWAFGVTTNLVDEVDVLWVGYAGAVYVPPPPPEFTTNVFVEAVVPMLTNYWNLTVGDAQNGNASALSDQSSSGFTAYFEQVVEDPALGYRPVVAQEFYAAQDLSEVGQAVTVSFDVELLDTPASNDKDFRVVFYDTGLNSSWFTGIDIGQLGTMNTRMLNYISGTDQAQFVPGDYAMLGLGYDTLTDGTVSIGNPDPGLNVTGVVNHIETTLARISSNEVAISTVWTAEGSANTGTIYCAVDESSPQWPAWMPPGDKWDSVDGFGIMIFADAPFAPASSGSFTVSNFEVTYTDEIGVDFSYEIADITQELSGDVTLTLSDPIIGATYTVMAKDNLILTWNTVGSYVAETPGVLNVPAVDLAPYTSDAGFMIADLPVSIVIE